MAAAAVYFTCFSTAAASRTAFWCWFVSGRAALLFLAFTFDYLPHRPHTSTRAQNPIKATSVTSLLSDTDAWLLTLPLLHQNYHNIHHIWPYIPFYRYSRAWQALSPALMDMGKRPAPNIKSRFSVVNTMHSCRYASAACVRGGEGEGARAGWIDESKTKQNRIK